MGDLLERASAIFCDSTLPTHYATLVCLRAQPDGRVEIGNAGHLPPVLVRASGETRLLVEGSGLPIGMFCSSRYESSQERLAAGDALVLCTDGVIDAEDADGAEFGLGRLEQLAARHARLDPAALVSEYAHALAHHRAAPHAADDVTMLVVRRR
jgi:sigma-B regulation protein RsbU (phosphoserine phosphatase)